MMIKVRANIFCRVLQLISLAGFSFVSSAQSNAEKRKTFTEAESFSLFDQSELANPLYLLLDKPDNYNIQYKIGTCYLRIDGEKEKAIPFLESAVKHASYDAKVTSFREKRAPLDAYFFLGKAYMINNQLDKALSTFEVFKKITGEVKEKESMRNASYIDQLIEACKTARSYQDKPIAMSSDLVSPGFSQGSINEDPAVSFDGNSIVYTERRGMVNAILYSKKLRGKWQPPIEITSQIKAGDDCSSCSLNKDGTLLFLYKTDNYDGNIYTS
jgi:tetratricopeptide (TPR) repeat protein